MSRTTRDELQNKDCFWIWSEKRPKETYWCTSKNQTSATVPLVRVTITHLFRSVNRDILWCVIYVKKGRIWQAIYGKRDPLLRDLWSRDSSHSLAGLAVFLTERRAQGQMEGQWGDGWQISASSERDKHTYTANDANLCGVGRILLPFYPRRFYFYVYSSFVLFTHTHTHSLSLSLYRARSLCQEYC